MSDEHLILAGDNTLGSLVFHIESVIAKEGLENRTDYLTSPGCQKPTGFLAMVPAAYLPGFL